MTETLIQEMRRQGRLAFFLDTRAGNFRDQGNGNLTITYPTDVSLGLYGLRVFSTPATVSIDLSDTFELHAFALLRGKQNQLVDQTIMSFAAVSNDGFLLEQKAVDNDFYGSADTAAGSNQSKSVNPYRTDTAFFCAHINRELSYEMIKPYYRGLLGSVVSESNINDGSAFADSTLSLMQGNKALMPVVGIIKGFLTSNDQKRLYDEIKKGLTK